MENVQTPAKSDAQTAQPAAPKTQRSRLKKILLGMLSILGVLLLVALYLYLFEMTSHSKPTQAPLAIQPSGDKALDAIRRGFNYLRVYQEADGGFSIGLVDPKPAVTALVLESLVKSPLPDSEKDPAMIKRATQAILSKQQPDGSICTPMLNLDVYSTSISLLALKALNDPAYAGAIEKAKQYLLKVQHDVEDGNPQFGGVGYGAKGNVDGGNTAQWIEALKEAGVTENDPAFKNETKFISRLQNSEENDYHLPDTEVGTDGGFVYRPGEGKDGEGKEGEDRPRSGKHIPKSYGMMSYAGLKSFLYMNVDKKESRVQSAWKWVKDNYTLEENKNIGADGLYYCYLTMAKALAVYGEPIVETSDGKKHDWARELEAKLLSQQLADGSWKNTRSGRWREDDNVMVTAFAIRTLAICRDFAEKHPAPAEASTAPEANKPAEAKKE